MVDRELRVNRDMKALVQGLALSMLATILEWECAIPRVEYGDALAVLATV